MAELDQLDPPPGRQGGDGGHQKVRDNLTKLKTSARGEWGDQVTELDEAVNAFQATISGISGDSLLSDLPTITGRPGADRHCLEGPGPADHPDLPDRRLTRRSGPVDRRPMADSMPF